MFYTALYRTLIPDYNKGKCQQDSQVIRHMLIEINAQISWLQNCRYYGISVDDLNFKHMTDKNKRHYAYQNYIDFMFGGNVVQPSGPVPAPSTSDQDSCSWLLATVATVTLGSLVLEANSLVEELHQFVIPFYYHASVLLSGHSSPRGEALSRRFVIPMVWE